MVNLPGDPIPLTMVLHHAKDAILQKFRNYDQIPEFWDRTFETILLQEALFLHQALFLIVALGYVFLMTLRVGKVTCTDVPTGSGFGILESLLTSFVTHHLDDCVQKWLFLVDLMVLQETWSRTEEQVNLFLCLCLFTGFCVYCSKIIRGIERGCITRCHRSIMLYSFKPQEWVVVRIHSVDMASRSSGARYCLLNTKTIWSPTRSMRRKILYCGL